MPDPEFLVALTGQRLGQILKDAVTKFVSERRSPANPLQGILSLAIFAAFPNTPDQDDIIARTIIGVMMGFLPTVEGNLTATVRAWQRTRPSLRCSNSSRAAPSPSFICAPALF